MTYTSRVPLYLDTHGRVTTEETSTLWVMPGQEFRSDFADYNPPSGDVVDVITATKPLPKSGQTPVMPAEITDSKNQAKLLAEELKDSDMSIEQARANVRAKVEAALGSPDVEDSDEAQDAADAVVDDPSKALADAPPENKAAKSSKK
jgi:hypothetical protein